MLEWTRRFTAFAVICVSVLTAMAHAATAPVDRGWRPASGALQSGDVGAAVRTVSAASDAQRFQFRFDAPQIVLSRDGFSDVSIPSLSLSGAPGEPLLPVMSVRLAIPQGHELVSLSVTPADPRDYRLEAPIRHAQQAYPLSRPELRIETAPRPGIYGSDEPFPLELNTPTSVQTKRGVSIVQFTLSPVAYRPLSGRVTAYTYFTVDLLTQPIAPLQADAVEGRDSWRARLRSDADLIAVSTMLDNPALLAQYTVEPLAADGGVGADALEPSDDGPRLPCRVSDSYRHVIVTTEDLRDGLITVGWAFAQTNTTGSGYIFIGSKAGSTWDVNRDDVFAEAAVAGGYPASADTVGEGQFIDNELAQLPDPSEATYAIEFDDTALDSDENKIPDWLELIPGIEVSSRTNRLFFPLQESAETNTFADIVAIRESQGISSVIVTLEAIQEAYFGIDDAESVRLFIRDAYDKWGSDYVLLGGDAEAIPTRMLFMGDAPGAPWDGRYLPSDLYFQCLDGSFNSDEDQIWGEDTDGEDREDGRPGDDVDLYAEVAVGRIPVHTGEALTNWVARQLIYERDRLAGGDLMPYQTGAIMVGEYLGFGGVSDYAEASLEEIRLGSTEHGYRTEGFASSEAYTNVVTLYDSPTNMWDVADLVALINTNQYSLINHLGHSDYDLNMKLMAGEPSELFTNEKPLFEYSQGCWAGAFDQEDSISAEFLALAPHGMFGGVFNSRYGWGAADSTDGPSQRYNRWFWNGLFGDGVPVIGLLNQYSHERNAARIAEPYMRYVYYESNLLGDPAQWLAGVEAYIKLDREAYASDGVAVAEVFWADAGAAQTTVDIVVESYDASDTLIMATNMVCSRVGAVGFTTRYQSPPIALAALAAVHGGTVRVRAMLPSVSGLTERDDEADIDDLAPEILNLRVEAVGDTWIEVAWETDTPAVSETRAGVLVPLDADWDDVSTEYVTNHTYRFEGLETFTLYHIAVRVADLVGNETMLPADMASEDPEAYFRVATVGRETVLRFDPDGASAGWSVTNINGDACWQFGQPEGYGPFGAPACWGTILDGRYRDGANAYLTSPAFHVRGAPVIQFRHWHQIQYSMDMFPWVPPSPPPYGDYGQIEVLRNGLWENVTAYADVIDDIRVKGDSEGWERVRVELPESFAHQTLAVRFRFVSDQQQFEDGNPAGWYVTDLRVEDVPSSGLGISSVSVVDAGPGLVGDGDGFAEAGETVSLCPTMFNYGETASGILTGEMILLVAGNPVGSAVLVDGTPTPISYASILPGQAVEADQSFRVALSQDIPAGAVLTLAQTVSNPSDLQIHSSFDLQLDPVVDITGRVTDALTGDPVAGVTITATYLDEILAALSQGDGSYALHGALASMTYLVRASQMGVYSPQQRLVTAPATGVDFAMGRSIAEVTPLSLLFDVKAGERASLPITVANAAAATAMLEAEVAEIAYGQDTEGWLSLEPDTCNLAPGASQQMLVTANAGALRPGVYDAVITLELNDPDLPEVDIAVEILVRREPQLVFAGTLISGDDDDDEILESGETGDMWVRLANLNGFGEAVDVTGTLTPLTNAVTINGSNQLGWDYVPPYGQQVSTHGVNMTVAPSVEDGTELPFELELVWSDGAVMVTNLLSFTYIQHMSSMLTGTVKTVVWDDEAGAIDTNAAPVVVTGAVVRAEDVYGNVYVSRPTDSNGCYWVEGVRGGDVWISVAPPVGSFAVAPAGSNVVVNSDPFIHDFLLNNYGTNAPLLKLEEIYVSDFSGDDDDAVDPGEELYVSVRLRNNEGTIPALMVTGVLAVADMGSIGPFMEVTQSEVYWPIEELSEESTYGESLYAFYVKVDENAKAGDRQRFWLTTQDGSEIPRIWPFDFSITVDPRYAVGGTVTYDNGDPAEGIRVTLTLEDGTTRNFFTDYYGEYLFNGLVPGASNLTVAVRSPEGYYAEPVLHPVDPVEEDRLDYNFVLKPSLITLSPTNLMATIAEGESDTATFTVGNGMDTNISAELRVEYRRSDYDVIPPEDDLLQPVFALAAQDWSQLDQEAFVPGEVEVRFADGVGRMEREEILRRHGLRALFHFNLVPACLAVPAETTALGSGDIVALAPLGRALNADSDILYAVPAAKATFEGGSLLPDDPLFGREYGLWNERQTGGTMGVDINVDGVWATVTTGSHDIVVAVCDTGIDENHADLTPNLWRNPLEESDDANGDGYPGARGVDDDGDAQRQLYHYHTQTDTLMGPETVGALFAPEMWRDSQTYQLVPGTGDTYAFMDGPNDVPDFFEPLFRGDETLEAFYARAASVTDVDGQVIADVFQDSDGDGISDIFEDENGNTIPDMVEDEDGDGIYNETGIDFRDQDVMQGMYLGDGTPLLNQKFVTMIWLGHPVQVLVEQWNEKWWNGYSVAAIDDDENGYGDDIHGWNFYHWDNIVSDGDSRSSHGTHVAGTIGAAGHNGRGVAGVNWDVSIMPLSLVDRAFGQFTSFSRIGKAIEYALEQGVPVSNHSYGGGITAGVMYEIMKIAEQRYNHLFVIAAGNDGTDIDATRSYPAYYSTVLNNVITVAAHDHDAQLASFTCWGKESVQIAAPGVDILSTASRSSVLFFPSTGGGDAIIESGNLVFEGDQFYRYLDGTSMAAPHVTGAAALLWAHAPAASYRAIKNAILAGAKHEPQFDGWVKSGGRLDVGRAFEALGRDWLALSTNNLELAAYDSQSVQVTFNPDMNTPAGYYEADVVVASAQGTRRLPVSLNVMDSAIAAVVGVDLLSDDDDDGFAESTETVRFTVELRNTGKGTFANLTGTLVAVTPGVVVSQATSTWDYLYGGESGSSLSAFEVTLPAGVPSDTLFDLNVTADSVPSQTLRVVLDTAQRHSVAGRVISADGIAVPNAIVECYGWMAGQAVSDADGNYRIIGLIAGEYDLRAIPEHHTRATELAVSVASNLTGVDLVVAAPIVAVLPDRIDTTLMPGMQTSTNLVVSNSAAGSSANAYAFDVEVMPRRRIGLFDDGDRLGVLVHPLTRMGFEVDLFTNNFDVVHRVYPAYGYEQIVQDVRYTHDAELVHAYDLVIADLTGPDGMGRVLSEQEESVLGTFMDKGGRILFTGGNPLSLPDNEGIGQLCGVALDRADHPADSVAVVADWDGAFVQLAAGDVLGSLSWNYDVATPLPDAQVDVLFTTGDAAKITRRTGLGERGVGEAYLWTGNPGATDWAAEGAWLDVLRDLIRQSFYSVPGSPSAPGWLAVSPVAGTAPMGGSETLVVDVDASLLGADEYHAVMILRGLDRGEELLALPVALTVTPHTLRAFTSVGVTDWRGVPLRGDGSSTSAMYQLIYAGADGEPGAPDLETGAPAGDDMLLATYPAGTVVGRMGEGDGVAPDSGRFDRLFANPLPVNTSNALVYVRAWENATFNTSIAYGDSDVRYALAFVENEQADFGAWSITNVVDVTRDSNTNSLSDGWTILYRPELDPRAQLEPLGISAEIVRSDLLEKRHPSELAPKPYRVVLSESNRFAFVLDMQNNRIVTIPADENEPHVTYGSAGTGAGQFSAPEGMGWDLRAGQHRLAVADTQNHRIQLFTYDPLSGALTYERTIGAYGTGNGQLRLPAGVAFDNTGRLFVADTGNHRIAIFRASDGSWLGTFNGSGTAYALVAPRGVCVDPSVSGGGVWVCDTGNNRVTQFSTAGQWRRTFGQQGSGDGQFERPVDVQMWFTGSRRRLVVADNLNNRIQIFSHVGAHLASLGTGLGGLDLPNGVAPVREESRILVADTGNGRLAWLELTLDVDADGMDDIWEDQHGLDSSTFDAYGDLDHDGLYNIAEFLIGTDPSKWDTNGDGESDGAGVLGLRDPLVAYEQPPRFYITAALISPYEIRWESEEGFVYTVETNATASPLGWGVLTTVPGSATGESSLVVTPPAGGQFYRVQRVEE